MCIYGSNYKTTSLVLPCTNFYEVLVVLFLNNPSEEKLEGTVWYFFHPYPWEFDNATWIVCKWRARLWNLRREGRCPFHGQGPVTASAWRCHYSSAEESFTMDVFFSHPCIYLVLTLGKSEFFCVFCSLLLKVKLCYAALFGSFFFFFMGCGRKFTGNEHIQFILYCFQSPSSSSLYPSGSQAKVLPVE